MNARGHLVGVEGLRHVVVRAGREHAHLVGRARLRRHHDHRHARGQLVAHARHQRRPIHARQHHVEQNQIERRAFHLQQRFGARIRLHTAESLARRDLRQQRVDIRVVLYDENGALVHSLAPSGAVLP